MRKLLWACVALLLMLAGVGYAAVRYVCDHPNAVLRRCLAVTEHVVASGPTAVPAPSQEAAPRQSCVEESPACESSSACPPEMMAEEDGGAMMPPALLPGGLVMCEEPDASELPVQPMPPVRDVVGALPWLQIGDDAADVLMPRVEEDAPKMPPVECEQPGSHTGSGQPAVMPRSK